MGHVLDDQLLVPVVSRNLSREFGAGASAYRLEDLEAWRDFGLQAQAAIRARSWSEADRLAASFCERRPDWPKGYLLRQQTMRHLEYPSHDLSNMLHAGIDACSASGGNTAQNMMPLWEALASLLPPWPLMTQQSEDVPKPLVVQSLRGDSFSEQVKFKSKVKGVKLLAHEQELVEEGKLQDITHAGASAIWLSTESARPADDSSTLVYRPMGDDECDYLLRQGVLPDTQPYQTIVEGSEGRIYAEKYMRGQKSVDSSPTTVVEFLVPRVMVRQLFAMQSKNEDGAISHGLGNKGGRGLPIFNASLLNGASSFRIVFVKRFEKKAVGAFGAGRKKL